MGDRLEVRNVDSVNGDRTEQAVEATDVIGIQMRYEQGIDPRCPAPPHSDGVLQCGGAMAGAAVVDVVKIIGPGRRLDGPADMARMKAPLADWVLDARHFHGPTSPSSVRSTGSCTAQRTLVSKIR